MSVTKRVLRVSRTDDPSAHLLLNVTQTSKTRPLDLKLVATEHEHLYHGAVKSNNLVQLQASNYRGDEDEWRGVLMQVLLQQRSDVNLDALQGLEIVAAISSETCTLTVRKNIGGITQRLGNIKLSQDDEKEEVSAFEWVDTAVAASDDLRGELVTLQASLESQQTQVTKLTEQLDELLKAKKEHEQQLLQKCAVLLDSKKAKIREQQRELHEIGKNGGKAGSSGSGKRKASEGDDGAGLHAAEDDGEDDDELVEEEENGQRTPEKQETEDDGSDDDGFGPPPKSSAPAAVSQKRGGKTHAVSKGRDNGSMDVDDIPPRRDLPFTHRTTRSSQSQEQQKQPAPAPAQEDDDTDDEL